MASPNFRRLIGDLKTGTVIKPLLDAYLNDANFRGIELMIEAQDPHDLAHGPDGWFHPSSHPLVPARQLYYYLNNPESFMKEPLGIKGILSVTMGKLLHKFVQECLDDLGIMISPTRANPEEPSTMDESTKSRGHYDGEVEVVVPTHPHLSRQLFEFKTRTAAAKLLDDLDLIGFKKKHPGYYAQVQEYMRMSGLQMAIVLMMQTGFPWELREFHIPYDPEFAESVADKYRYVIGAVKDQDIPEPCCSPRSDASRQCSFRGICPVART